MNIEAEFRKRLIATFRPLNNVVASRSFPSPATLSSSLIKKIPIAGVQYCNITPQLASYFGTAAVEIWHRSVHSFLISISLTDASPVWTSVSGYYSSHYSIRGMAHLLGYFYLFKNKKIVQLDCRPHSYTCSFIPKPSGISRGEHQLYWSLVKQDPVFAADPFFTENRHNVGESDVAHRNFANYADHICKYPTFHPLDRASIKNRVDRISKSVFGDAMAPKLSNFPDVGYIQLIAYHRLVSFRKILDEVLGHDNRFWNVHRNPSFATEFMNFQLVEGGGLTQSE